MTNRDLILALLNTDLDAEVDLKRTIGEITFRPETIGVWLRDGQQSVICSTCGCKVSIRASSNMDFCFKCGSKMIPQS